MKLIDMLGVNWMVHVIGVCMYVFLCKFSNNLVVFWLVMDLKTAQIFAVCVLGTHGAARRDPAAQIRTDDRTASVRNPRATFFRKKKNYFF